MKRQAGRVGAALLLTACPAPDAGQTASATASDDTLGSSASSEDMSASASSLYITITDSWASGDSSSSAPTTDTTTTEPTTGSTTGDPTTGSTTDEPTTGSTTATPTLCKKKIDILFAIDNSPDMTQAHFEMTKMLPDFIDRIEEDFSDWDYHMMVVKGEDGWGSPFCEERCDNIGTCDSVIPGYPCDHDPDVCDMTLGAGVKINAGSAASNTMCPIDGDQRYIKAGQTDLEGTLDCLRRVGYQYNHNRHQVQSVLDAVSPEHNAPGACNENFLREDAYLVIFFVVEGIDWFTEGTPQEWAETLLATKGGKFDKVYLLGFFDGIQDGSSCGESIGDNDSLYEWTEEIYHSYAGTYCKDMMPPLDAALDYVIDDCGE